MNATQQTAVAARRAADARAICPHPCRAGGPCACMPDIEPPPDRRPLSRGERVLLIAIVLTSAGIPVSLALHIWLRWWA